MRIESSGSAKVYYPARSREEIVHRLCERGRYLVDRIGLLRLVLFGSYARGDETAASDVDVLVVYDGPKRPDDYAVVRDALDVRGLQLHVYTGAEAAANADVIERMTSDGIEIY